MVVKAADAAAKGAVATAAEAMAAVATATAVTAGPTTIRSCTERLRQQATDLPTQAESLAARGRRRRSSHGCSKAPVARRSTARASTSAMPALAAQAEKVKGLAGPKAEKDPGMDEAADRADDGRATEGANARPRGRRARWPSRLRLPGCYSTAQKPPGNGEGQGRRGLELLQLRAIGSKGSKRRTMRARRATRALTAMLESGGLDKLSMALLSPPMGRRDRAPTSR